MKLGVRESQGLVIATLVAVAVVACTGLLGFDGLRLAPREGGAVADLAVDAGAEASCAHRVPPPRPNVADGGGTLDLVFALYMLDFGYGLDDAGLPRYKSLGYDLDLTCTGEGQGPSCAEPSWANGNHNDGLDGIDNATAEFSDPFLPPSYVFTGDRMTGMVRIRGYSGEPDDDQIEVSFYIGLQVEPREEAEAGPGQDAGGVALWDGNDRWTLHPDMLVSAADGAKNVDRPKFVDGHAYVSGGILVSRFQEFLAASGPPFALGPFEQVVFTARMVQVSPDRWELQDGVIGSRQKLKDALGRVAYGPKSLMDPTPICQDEPSYDLVKQKLCALADISSGPDSLSSSCDAVSVSLGVWYKPALFGAIGSVTISYPQCAPNVHPETDSCNTLTQ